MPDAKLENFVKALIFSRLSNQALYRLGMHAQAADIYAEIFGDEGEEKGDGDRGFPSVSVNLAAAYAAAGNGDAALERFPAEDVRRGILGNPGGIMNRFVRFWTG